MAINMSNLQKVKDVLLRIPLDLYTEVDFFPSDIMPEAFDKLCTDKELQKTHEEKIKWFKQYLNIEHMAFNYLFVDHGQKRGINSAIQRIEKVLKKEYRFFNS